jgi:hypothetical protein
MKHENCPESRQYFIVALTAKMITEARTLKTSCYSGRKLRETADEGS